MRPLNTGFLVIAVAAAAALTAVACGSGDGSASPDPTASGATAAPAASTAQPTADPLAGSFSMGGADLGGSSTSSVLAAFQLPAAPAGPVEWVAHQVTLEPGESIDHSHEFSFVYAASGGHEIIFDGAPGPASQLSQGEGRAVPGSLRHTHRATAAESTFWEARLAAPGSGPADGVSGERLVFRSGPLQGIPGEPAAAFVVVTVPPGGQTSVHTHPGPEFIYQYEGIIDYQNEFTFIGGMEPGEFEGIPARTAVQKRNESGADAVFLSWFLVDPDLPFASPARFDEEPGQSAGRGPNLALPENGGSVTAFSSSFGRGTPDSPFGANSAIDGDPGTEWSSFDDGDAAFIEIALASRTSISSVGFWTRTMGTSAEIFSFTVTTDEGETLGPFVLDGASAIQYFDTGFTASTLRFQPADSSGGNTGAVEIEIYGEPAGPAG